MTDPIKAFLDCRELAKEKNDPNAYFSYLATALDGQASNRVMMLSDDRPLTLFCNRTSPKYKHLTDSGGYELLTFWPSISCQFRLRGGFEELPTDVVEHIWEHRDYISKIRDLYYDRYLPQSTVLPSDKAELELTARNNLKKEFPEGSDMPFPKDVVGIKLLPNRIEWWGGWQVGQGGWARYLYTLQGDSWTQQALVF